MRDRERVQRSFAVFRTLSVMDKNLTFLKVTCRQPAQHMNSNDQDFGLVS